MMRPVPRTCRYAPSLSSPTEWEQLCGGDLDCGSLMFRAPRLTPGPGGRTMPWETRTGGRGDIAKDRPLILIFFVPIVLAAIGLITGAVRLWRARTSVAYRVCAGLLVLIGLYLLLLVGVFFVDAPL